MGDFAAVDLWSVSYMNVSVDTPCAGCGERIKPDDRCYGKDTVIWHSGCWPSTAAQRVEMNHFHHDEGGR